MDNQPILKEYLNSKHDDVIMSENGSFFLAKPKNTTLFNIFKWLFRLIFLFLIPLLIKLDNAWFNISIDILLLWPLLLRALAKIEYANCSFECINDDYEDHEEAIGWLRSHTYRNRVGYKILIGLVVIFAIANSFTMFYLRSLVDKKTTISDMNVTFFVVESENGLDYYNCENLSEIVIPDTTITGIYINTEISGTPDTYQFKLNDRILSDIHCNKNISFIWNKKIFPQNYYGNYDLNDLHNNSILEISSGSFSRQWTIKTISQ